jgi:hypothetical protein
MEPFDTAWMESLQQTSPRTLRRVMANPADIKK